VRLAGRIGRAELDQLYQRACVFALATRHEGYGMVFDEALVHGLPIVSTTAGAVPGTVPRDAGVLVPPDDARSFATALRDLLADETARARRSAAAAQAGAALPTWAKAAERAAAVLTRAAGATA
jgi:glycosyltransferase involved in cell wall biosynthesis